MKQDFEQLGDALRQLKAEILKVFEPVCKPILERPQLLMAFILATGVALGMFISSQLWAHLCVNSETVEINGKQHICMEVIGED